MGLKLKWNLYICIIAEKVHAGKMVGYHLNLNLFKSKVHRYLPQNCASHSGPLIDPGHCTGRTSKKRQNKLIEE